MYSESVRLHNEEELVSISSGGINKFFDLGTIYAGVENSIKFNLKLVYKTGVHIDIMDNDELPRSWILSVPKMIVEGESGYYIDVNGNITSIEVSNNEEYHYISKTYDKEKNYYIKQEGYSNGMGGVRYYWVKYNKDGSIEYYELTTGVILCMISSSGEMINFSYDTLERRNPYITRIYNDRNDYISITHSDYDNDVNIEVYSAGRKKYVDIISGENFDYKINELIYRHDTRRLTHQFEYDHDEALRAYLIKEIRSFSGDIEDSNLVDKLSVEYGTIKKDDETTYPVVVKTIKHDFPETNEQEVIEYIYSENNFLGYKPGVPYDPSVDNCIARESGYTYTVEKKFNNYSELYTFNRFHCVIEMSTIENGSTIVKIENTYNISKGDITEQSNNYRLPLMVTTTYFNNTAGVGRSESQGFLYDDNGNIITSNLDSGVKIEYQYYDKESFGFPNNIFYNCMKNIKIFDKSGILRQTFSTPSVEKVGKTYSVPLVNQTKSTRFIVPNEKKVGDELVETYEYSDVDNPSLLTKLIKKNVLKNEDVTISYSYSPVSNNNYKITKTESWLSCGNVVDDVSYKVIRSDGTIIEESDISGSITKIEYYNGWDENIRSITKNNNEKEIYTYEEYKNTIYGVKNVITVTNENNNNTVTSYTNKSGLITHTYKNNVLIKSFAYKNKLLELEVLYDSSGIEQHTKYKHDILGNLIEKEYPDGLKEKITIDLELNKSTSYYESRNKSVVFDSFVVYKNNRDDITKVDIVKNNGDTRTINEFVYDDLDRVSEVKNPFYGNSSTQFEYDGLNRVIKKKSIAVDNYVNDTLYLQYQSYHTDNVISKKLESTRERNNPVLHMQYLFDAAGRLTAEGETSFGSTVYNKNYEYHGNGSTIPKRITYKGKLSYSSELEDHRIAKEKIYSSNESYTTYTYEYENDIIVNAIAKKTYNQVDYPEYFSMSVRLNDDLQEIEKTLFIDGVSYTIDKEYSIGGSRLISLENHLGKQQNYTYDNVGRLVEKNYSSILDIYCEYNDETGMPDKISLSSTDLSISEFDVYFSYDNNNREIKRIYSSKSNVLLTIENIYDSNSKLISKVYKKENDLKNIKFSYEYTGDGVLAKSSNTKEQGNTRYYYGGGGRVEAVYSPSSNHELGYFKDAIQDIEIDNSKLVNYYADSMGNTINNHNDAGYSYDYFNRIEKSESFGTSGHYEHFYDHNNKLIISNNNSIGSKIVYIYDGDILLGEIEGDYKTLYIRFNEMVIGRYIESPTTKFLEIYGSDIDGSVIMISCKDGNNINGTYSNQYFTYSDYGMKSEWI